MTQPFGFGQGEKRRRVSSIVARAPPFAMLGRRPAIVAVVGATLFLGAFLATEQVSRPACPAMAQPAPRNLPPNL